MSWIKRNLYFVIGTLVALGLMGYGGFRLYNAVTTEQGVSDEIQKLYSDLDQLKKQNPHPGSAASGKVDNVKAAKEQEAMLREFIGKSRAIFVRPAPIPDSTKLTDKDFKTELSTTIAQLTRAAKDASVTIPTDYYFTFQAQKPRLQFDAGSLEKMASHLGEIKVICDALFAAKVNGLDLIQREVISPMDDNPTDYIADKTMNTSLADITPYRVVFRCFSAELAQVLSGFANSPYGLVVKTVNIEPVEVGTDAADATPAPMVVMPNQQTSPYGNRYQTGRYGPRQPQPTPTAPVAPVANKPTVLLNEHQVKVTMLIELIKLKAENAPPAAPKSATPRPARAAQP